MKAPASDKVFDFADGIAMLKSGDKVGFMNAQLKTVVEPKYQIIKEFQGNYARFKNNGLWGILDKTGKVVVPADYADIGDYNKGTWVKKGEAYGVINNGKYTEVEGASKIWDWDESELTYAKKGDKIGFIDHSGKWVIEPKFDKARAFHKGLAPVCNEKKWGYVNAKGTFAIDTKYADAEVFSEDGFAPVKEKHWGFINTSGKLVIPTDYDINIGGGFNLFKQDKTGFDGGLVRVKKDKKWGFLKPDGTLLGNQWFDNAELFSK